MTDQALRRLSSIPRWVPQGVTLPAHGVHKPPQSDLKIEPSDPLQVQSLRRLSHVSRASQLQGCLHSGTRERMTPTTVNLQMQLSVAAQCVRHQIMWKAHTSQWAAGLWHAVNRNPGLAPAPQNR